MFRTEHIIRNTFYITQDGEVKPQSKLQAVLGAFAQGMTLVDEANRPEPKNVSNTEFNNIKSKLQSSSALKDLMPDARIRNETIETLLNALYSIS
jgi:hypothetical protein